MFPNAIDIKLGALTHKLVKDANKNPKRLTYVRLKTELSDEIANGLGPAGQSAVEHLKSGKLRNGPIIDLGSGKVKITFDDNTQAETGKHVIEAAGVEARTLPPRKEGSAPTVEMVFAFATRADQYSWLVDRTGCPMRATITATGEQPELKPAKKGNRAKADELPGTAA